MFKAEITKLESDKDSNATTGFFLAPPHNQSRRRTESAVQSLHSQKNAILTSFSEGLREKFNRKQRES